jgi:integrase/recombinase XerD
LNITRSFHQLCNPPYASQVLCVIDSQKQLSLISSTMFSELFKYAAVIAKHSNASFADERNEYLRNRHEEGRATATILRMARELLVIVKELDIPSEGVTAKQIATAADRWARRQKRIGRARTERFSREVFISVATDWLRFTNRLRQEPRCEKPEPEAELLNDFVSCLDSERGLSQNTITGYLWYTRNFLRWCEQNKMLLAEVRPEHLDLYFVERGAGGWSRVSHVKSANALRAFFRHAARRLRCQPLIEQSIQGPPIYRLEALPDAPHWSEVVRLTDRLKTNRPLDVAD